MVRSLREIGMRMEKSASVLILMEVQKYHIREHEVHEHSQDRRGQYPAPSAFHIAKLTKFREPAKTNQAPADSSYALCCEFYVKIKYNLYICGW